MSAFRAALEALSSCSESGGRRWLFVPYDQLTDQLGPLAREDPAALGIVVVESRASDKARPYHKQRLALLLANLRHFALEQARRGVHVRHVVSEAGYAEALAPIIAELGPLRVMQPAERELRAELASLVEQDGLEVLPHEGWLTSTEEFLASQPKGPPWRMDAFYREARRRSGLLMEGGKPLGGKFSHDTDNRKPWPGHPAPPSPPTFEPDAVTREVGELVERRFAAHPGTLDLESLPVTRDDAERVWSWAREECLPHFGPYEDAMTVHSAGLFHTRASALINLHRLLPKRVVEDVADLDIPLSSKEGFIRQVLGWREFVRHVHVQTDGFRDVSPEQVWERATTLPPAFWGSPSGLGCLDRVVSEVWETGWGHHITRLMVLCNIATLLDVSPRELSEWFRLAYVDAFDWVVEPNVLGMGTFWAGDLMTTKPYVSGSNYIDRMSDYCDECSFDPRTTCPLTPLYWAFLGRHEDRLARLPRLRLPLVSLRKRSPAKRSEDEVVFLRVRETLTLGRRLTPSASDR
jgi:deoxyribodipyrimidine photolyase-related protein